MKGGDVSRAWNIWSSAVEAALADAYQFAGGPVPGVGVLFWHVLLGWVTPRFVRRVGTLRIHWRGVIVFT